MMNEINSVIDLCEWLSNHGWHSRNDAQWTRVAPLWDEIKQLRDKLAAAEKIFNHFGGLSELSKWENGQGETAANVVQEYLEL